MTLPDQQIVLFSLLAFDMQRQDAQCDWRARADFLRVGSAFSKCRIVIRIA
jgi:hypothetical protein